MISLALKLSEYSFVMNEEMLELFEMLYSSCFFNRK